MATPQAINATVPACDRVISLDHLAPADGARVGRKALNLGLMRQAGLPVPAGFCVTTAAFEHWIVGTKGVREAIAQLDQIAWVADGNTATPAAALRATLAGAPIPEQTVQAIRGACERFPGVASWAVRSSATSEDLPDGSFAGQHDSFLSVNDAGAVIEAVWRCWVSLFTDRAVVYRARRRLGSATAAMAVVVQEMVRAEVAGVLFTADPVRQNPNHMVIEGAQGCGDVIVAGQVTPERVVLDRNSQQVIQRSADGHVHANNVPGITLPAPTAEIPNHARTGPSPDRPLLDESLIRRLSGLALEAERLFGGPQDLEWAACNGAAYLLQARPITTPTRRVSAPPEVWCNANVCENLPGVLTPMSWSLVELLLVGCFRPILRLVGINTDVRPWFGRVAGRAYLNVGVSDEILRRAFPAMPVSVWDLLGGRPTETETAALQDVRQHAPSLPWRHRMRLLLLALRAIPATSERSSDAFLRTLRQRMDALAQTSFSTLPDQELAAFIPGIVPRLIPEMERPAYLVQVITSFGLGLGCVVALSGVTRRWLEDTEGRLARRLLTGAGSMASTEAGLELWQLAAWLRGRPRVRDLIEAGIPFGALRAQLGRSEEGAAFLERWTRFMHHHGHHARGEVDVFNARWSETPDEMLDWVRHYLRLPDGFNPLEEQARRRQEGNALLDDCRRRLRDPVRRWLLGYLVRRARHGLALRENVKSEAVRSVALLRAAVLEAGHRLESRGALPDRTDVFFLELHELQAALRGETVPGLPQAVSRRKAERVRLEAIEPPSIVVGDFVAGTEVTRPRRWTEGDGCELEGLAVSPGVVTGRARVVSGHDGNHRLMPGEILVVPCTDPGYTPLFLTAAGIVADVGGQLSHGSIIAREYGIPAVVNVGHATRTLRTGQRIEVDGDRGVVRVLPSTRTPS